MFNQKVISTLADAVESHSSSFDKSGFMNAVINNAWEERELKDRINHVANCLYDYLPGNYEEAAGVIQKVSKDLPAGFEQMPLPTYVEHYGVNDFNISMKTLEVITQGSTGEFAVRPFIKEGFRLKH